MINANLKRRYELFNTLFKKLEDDVSQIKSPTESASKVAGPPMNGSGIRWSDIVPKTSFQVNNVKYRTEIKFPESVMTQEKRMKQVIDTYNQAVRIKWRPEGSRSRPLTADPKQSKK